MREKFRGKYRIEANRYRLWNYSSPGKYFLTIYTHQRKRIFGQVIDGRMTLSDAGHIVAYHLIEAWS